MLKKIFLGILVSLFFVGTANAWYIELSDPVNTVGTKHKSTLSFYGEGETINVNGASLAVSWSDSLASVASVIYPTYTRTYGYYSYTIWTGAGVPHGIDGTTVYAMTAEEPISEQGNFLPSDGTVLMSVVWDVNPGTVGLTGYLLSGVETTVVTVGITDILEYGKIPGLQIYDSDRKIGPAAVIPIPGAIYLLASGLIGLIGLRRRTR